MRSPVERLNGRFGHNVRQDRLLTPVPKQRLYPRLSSSHAPTHLTHEPRGRTLELRLRRLTFFQCPSINLFSQTKGAPQGIGLIGDG